jgi:hypothetical protein
MCINLQTSIVAFTVGEICGLILATENNEKRALGLFIMFFSFVQLCEAYIYYYGKDETTLASRLLLINLGLQGIIFFILFNYYLHVNIEYFLICGIISLLVTFKAITKNFKVANIESCMKWNFIDNITQYLFYIMYITMFTYALLSSNNTLNISAKYFILTYIIAFLLPGNGPSLWCLISAFTAPLLLLL